MKIIIKHVLFFLIAFYSFDLVKCKPKYISRATRHWLESCKESSCDGAFEACKMCNGETQCQKCIKESALSCLKCAFEIYDKADQEHINGTHFLLCDPEEELQSKVCHMFCRGIFRATGRCQIVDNIPLCICSRSTILLNSFKPEINIENKGKEYRN